MVDSPGHRDFIKNMYAGLILADCAVLVVAAPPGEYESGLYFGQTPEHAKLAYISGIKDFVVCVTKIDQVPFADVEARFNKIVVDITAMLTKVLTAMLLIMLMLLDRKSKHCSIYTTGQHKCKYSNICTWYQQLVHRTFII